MTDFLSLAKNRYSCRKFADKAVPDDMLRIVLEAGRIAPSAVNFQPWKFLVFTTPTSLKKVHQLYHREWFNSAPVVILICADHAISWKRKEDGKDYSDVDAAIAIDHMTLEATSLGLATCWVCNFFVEKTRKELELPENLEPIAFLPLGYPLDEPDINRHDSKRKEMADVVRWE
ncbi:MAG: nitroreductase family protein [Bacteroidota bacterium]